MSSRLTDYLFSGLNQIAIFSSPIEDEERSGHGHKEKKKSNKKSDKKEHGQTV